MDSLKSNWQMGQLFYNGVHGAFLSVRQGLDESANFSFSDCSQNGFESIWNKVHANIDDKDARWWNFGIIVQERKSCKPGQLAR